MAKTLRLEIKTGGQAMLDILDKATEKTGKLADEYGRLTSAQKAMMDAGKTMKTSVDRQADAVRKAIDPWKRLADAQKRFADAQKNGDKDAQRLAELQLARAEAAAKRADSALDRRKNPLGHAMQDMLMTSRINMKIGGVNLMPLVGKAMKSGLLPDNFISDVIGGISDIAGKGGGASGPATLAKLAAHFLGGSGGGRSGSGNNGAFIPPGGSNGGSINRYIPAGGAGGSGGGGGIVPFLGGAAGGSGGGGAAASIVKVAGILGIIALALRAKLWIWEQELKALRWAVGQSQRFASETFHQAGTQFSVGGTSRQMAQLRGLSTGLGHDLSSEALQFGQNIHSSGSARAAAASIGVNPIGGPFGDRNYAQKFLQTLDRLRRVDERLAQSLAERMGMNMETVGMARMMSNSTWKQLMNSTPVKSRLDQRWSAEQMGQQGITQNNGQKMLDSLGRTFQPMVTVGNEMLNRYILGPMSEVMDDFSRRAQETETWMFDKMGLGPGKDDKKADATNKNTEAIMELSKIIGEGMYGMGAGAASRVVPGGVGAVGNAERWAYGQKVAIGGISL